MFWNPSTSQPANQISCQSVKLPFLSELTTNSFIFSAVDLSILDTSWYIHLPLFAWPQSFIAVIHSSAHLFNPAASTCPFSPSFIQDPCYQLRQTSCSFVCLCLFVCWFVTHSLPVLVSFPIVWKLRSAQHLLIVMLFQFGRSFVHSFIHPFIRSFIGVDIGFAGPTAEAPARSLFRHEACPQRDLLPEASHQKALRPVVGLLWMLKESRDFSGKEMKVL